MTIHIKINIRKIVAIAIAVFVVFGLLWAVDALAAPYPTGVGGTGTTAAPSAGQVLVGTGNDTYTPSYILCAGTCSVSSASGTITITGTGVATTTGDWQGTWQLYSPSDFLSSSTPVVNGSGTLNCLPLFVGTSTISDSSICDDGAGNYYIAGHNIELDNGQALTSVSGNIIQPDDGSGNTNITSNNGDVNITGSTGAAITGNNGVDITANGASLILTGNAGTILNGGTINLSPSGSQGVSLTDPNSTYAETFDSSDLTQNQNFVLPNVSGTPYMTDPTEDHSGVSPYDCASFGPETSTLIDYAGTSCGTVYKLYQGFGLTFSSGGTLTTNGTVSVNTSSILSLLSASGTGLSYSTSTGKYTWTNPGYITTSTNNFGGLTNASITAVSPIVWSSSSTVSCPTCIATNTGNWSGTWQGANSTTFYLASNPAGYVTSTSGGVSTSTANTWSALQTFTSGISAASVTLPYTSASGTFSYSLKNDGNYLEINDTTGTIPGTSPVPYDIILQNCPPVSTTSTAVTSSSWECALSQAENFPDGSRSFVDWDTEYYPTGTNPNVASGWFDNRRGTSSVEFPFELSWNDGSVNHVGFSMTPATNTSASNFNTLDNNGTGYFTVGTASSTTGAFDVYQNGASTCAGIYDSGASTIYGLTDSLPAPAGCTALGGYYKGLAIGGSSSGTGSPIFGVLNSSQSSNGRGHTAFTVYDTNEVDTYNNELDDGNGNATIAGTLNASATITQAGVPVCTTTNCLASSTALVSTFNGASGAIAFHIAASGNVTTTVSGATTTISLTGVIPASNGGTATTTALGSNAFTSTTIPVTYVSTLNGSSGTYKLYAGGILSIATGTASTTISLSTSTLNTQVAALGYVTSTSGGSGLASTTPWVAQNLTVASGTGVATISTDTLLSYIPFMMPQILGTSTVTQYYFAGYSNGVAATNSVNATGTLYALPIYIAQDAHVANIEADCEGQCNGRVEMGIYNTVNGLPGNLVADAGNVSTTLGTFRIALNQQVHPGQDWLVIDYNTTSTIKSYSTNSLIPIGGVAAISPSTPNYAMWTATLAYGALPSSFPTSSLALVASPPYPIIGIQLNP